MSAEERAALCSLLALRKDIKIQPVNKGGEVVIVYQYVSKTGIDLANTGFYEKSTEDPTS